MRKSSIFEDVIKLPWPVGVGLAAIVFFISHTYQLVAPQTQLSQAILPAVRMITYFFIAMFLLAAFLSFLTQKIRSKRFKTTKSMSDLRSLTWRQFESFTGELFREQGYFVLETSEGPDNGVDLVLKKDGEKTYVQCKHWKANTVGVEKVRELLGAMTAGGAHNGIFVASGNYTKPAREFARECGIRLVDGDEFAQLIGSIAEERRDNPPISEHTTEVVCPVCDAPMVKRIAKRGSNAGNSFWGCSKYPQCRGIRHV
jgi:restriction system protein